MGNLYFSRHSTVVLRHKSIPPRPTSFDGRLLVQHLEEGVGVAQLLAAFRQWDENVTAEYPFEWLGLPVPRTACLRLQTHDQALAAAAACQSRSMAVSLGLGVKVTVMPLYNETSYDDSGWCNFEQGAALISAGLDLPSKKDDKLAPPKLIDISNGRVEVVELSKPPTARELERRIRRARFVGKADRIAVIKQMREMRSTLESVTAQSAELAERMAMNGF